MAAARAIVMSRIARALANGWIVALIFTVITIAATWPLASVMVASVLVTAAATLFVFVYLIWALLRPEDF